MQVYEAKGIVFEMADGFKNSKIIDLWGLSLLNLFTASGASYTYWSRKVDCPICTAERKV